VSQTVDSVGMLTKLTEPVMNVTHLVEPVLENKIANVLPVLQTDILKTDIVSMNVVLKPIGKITKLPVIQTTTVDLVNHVTLGVTNVTDLPITTVSTVLTELSVLKNTKPPSVISKSVLADQNVQFNTMLMLTLMNVEIV
jgi:hypothetical protein